MLHDDKGTQWNKCSALFVRFDPRGRPATPAEMRGAPTHYLGGDYEGWVSNVDIPPRPLSAGWEEVGEVRKIWYTRQGTKAPGKYWHPFNKRVAMFLWTKGETPILYRRGDAMRLEMKNGCIWDDRGIVRP
jgi:hypothetical protein